MWSKADMGQSEVSPCMKGHPPGVWSIGMAIKNSIRRGTVSTRSSVPQEPALCICSVMHSFYTYCLWTKGTLLLGITGSQHINFMTPRDTSYGKLALMAGLHLIAMFFLMFAMVNTFANAIPNINFVYMAALMTAPMLILEILLMGMMYKDRKLNVTVVCFGLILLAVSFLLIRFQTGVGDRGFLQSMIPHHSGAILMCEKANITDPEIKQLCDDIILSQRQEITQMKEILSRLDR